MPELWADRAIVRRSLAARLREGDEPEVAAQLERCGLEVGYLRCWKCGDARLIRYRCNQRWCPECAWRITLRRIVQVSAWFRECRQPKHVVLTSRNAAQFDPRPTVQAFAKIRRQKPFRWRRGCRTLETTNEGRGWHVHIHALTDVRWIDQPELARRWGKLMGQDFAIVHVSDAREMTYLAEVAKYAVKPAQMAGWSATDCATFVRGMRRTRAFASWGWQVPQPPPQPRVCEHCGATDAWEFEPFRLAQQVDAMLQHW